jgi:ssDNA-binding Zn-finger/Zn-ribbon topoisomerase 1
LDIEEKNQEIKINETTYAEIIETERCGKTHGSLEIKQSNEQGDVVIQLEYPEIRYLAHQIAKKKNKEVGAVKA